MFFLSAPSTLLPSFSLIIIFNLNYYVNIKKKKKKTQESFLTYSKKNSKTKRIQSKI